jgi:predicted nucleotidyltransferase
VNNLTVYMFFALRILTLTDLEKISLNRQLLILPFLLISLTVASQNFTEQTSVVLPGFNKGTVAWGDYDNDRDADILVTGSDATNNFFAKIFRNNGGNSFVEQTTIFSPVLPNDYLQIRCVSQWTDINNDGLLDALITAPSSTGLYRLLVYGNLGNNTFQLKATFEYWTWYGNSLDCGDYDNDGDYDILMNTDNSTKIFQNQGNFVFTDQTSIKLDGLGESACKWGDFDNDGDLDILMTGSTGFYNRAVRLYRNDGGGVFTPLSVPTIAGYYNGSAEWADYNNDGFPDILLCGGNYNTYIYKNNGNSTFTLQSGIILPMLSEGTAKWGDIDNDGDQDIVVSGKESNLPITKVYLNNGNNTFSLQAGITIEGVYENSFDLFDYDDDNDLDLVITGNRPSGRICKVYKNNFTTVNPLPAAPTGLTVIASGNDVILKWRKVTTDNTAAKSISYNIMAGSTSGSINLISPNSSTTDGYHRVSGMGNAQLDTIFILRNLKKGTYFWRVQAIDGSFKGSPFSAESSFSYLGSVQASALNVPVKDGQSATLKWTRGNGTNVVVFLKEAVTGTAAPVDNTTYSASAVFKSGTQLGTTGWYCVYNGSLNTINVTGLKASTGYIFQVFEYEGSAGAEKYYSNAGAANPGNFVTGTFSELKGMLAPPVTSMNYSGASNAFWIDIDNDDDLDVFLLGYSASTVYRNDGSGSFVILPFTLQGGYSAVCGDYNNDGFIDIAISGNPTLIYKNNGNSTFTLQPNTTLPGNSMQGPLDWGDYDNDGDLDLIVSGNAQATGRTCKIFRNNGNNTFTDQENVAITGMSDGFVKWFDYDNDGNLDFIISGFDNNAVITAKVYRNDGKGSFNEQKGSVLKGVSTSTFDIADYDNDGDDDLLVTGNNILEMVTKLYRNDGPNGFTEQTSVSFPVLSNSSARWGDYDNDGDNDILLTGYREFSSGQVSKIFINNGNSTFTEDLSAMLPPISKGIATFGDYDKDGDLDILFHGTGVDGIIARIYRNDMTLLPNVKPAAPAGITSTVDKSDVILRWKSIKTDKTDAKTLTYNIRTGTATGGINIMAPHTSEAGVRRLAAPGNMQHDTTFTFRKMPFGTYYWSVQAIDNGFAGGTYSSEGTFTVSPVQAKSLSAKIKSSNSLLLKWERGNGDRCIVFCKQASSGTAIPVNNTGYSPDSEFGFGQQVGTSGWYCVYDGRADSVTVTGLLNNKQYSFHIFEYMGTFGSQQYFTQVSDGNPGVFSTSLFAEQTGIVLNSPTFASAVWGDYDNDGFVDFLLPGNPSRIYRNNGNNTFTEKTGIALMNCNYGSCAWGDYDNDSDLDLIITGATSVNVFTPLNPMTKIYRNDGADVFTEQTQIILPAVYYSSVDWGDYDKDGDLDILITGATGTSVDFQPVSRIYTNNGNNSFTLSQLSLTPILRGSGKWVDYDNDGDLDVFITGATDNRDYGNGIAKMYRNNGKNSFVYQPDLYLPGNGWSSSEWGDYDNDGDMDVILTTRGFMGLYQNQGNNTFVNHMTFNPSFQDACFAAWGDYDNDGFLDFMLTNPGLDTKIFRNTHGVQAPAGITNWFNRQDDGILSSVGYSFIRWIDYDNDGDLDFMLNKEYLPVKTYMNNLIMKSGLFKANTAPPAPTGTSSLNSPKGVELKWNPVLNDNTPALAMYYNVSVSTRKDSANICPPMSASTGFRKIPAMGNAQLGTDFVLKNLPARKYYWRVQAVDQSLAGGAWSKLDSIEVKNVLAYFTADTVCHGTQTTFKNTSVAYGETIQGYKWVFGDGATSTATQPTHVFSSSGVKNVKLIVYSDTKTDTLVKSVLVKANPPVDFSASVTCQGAETTIQNLTNTAGFTILSWSWDYGDGKGSVAQNPGTHGFLTAGEYSMSLQATASNGCSASIVKKITVSAIPVAAVTANGPLSFCKGDSVTLSVPYNKDYLYTWKLDGINQTGGNTSSFRAKQTGQYTVQVVNSIGNCPNVSAPQSVTARPAPQTPAIQSLNYTAGKCPGDNPVRLSATQPAPGYSYRWIKDGSTMFNDTLSYVDVYEAGNYRLVADVKGCTSQSEVFKIEYPEAYPKPILYTQGPNIWYLACSNSTAQTYKWYFNGKLIENAASYVYVAGQRLGKYQVSIGNAAGCFTRSDIASIPPGLVTGIEEPDQSAGLVVYPNPTSGKFSIQLDGNMNGELKVKVVAQDGRLAGLFSYEKTGYSFSTQVDLSGKPKGMYLLYIEVNRKVFLKKLIIE